MSDFSIEISASVPKLKDIENDIKALGSIPISLSNITVDTDSIKKQIQNAITNESYNLNIKPMNTSGIQKQAQKSGNISGQAFSKTFTRSLSVQKTVESAFAKYEKLGGDSNPILKNAKQYISDAKKFQSEMATLTGDAYSKKYQDYATAIAKANTEFAKSADNAKTYQKAVAELGNEKLGVRVSDVVSKYNLLGGDANKSLSNISSVISEIKTLQNDLLKLKDTDPSSFVQCYDKLINSLQKADNMMTAFKNNAKGTVSALQVSSLDNKMNTWLEENGKAAKDYGDSIRKLSDELRSMDINSDTAASTLQRIDEEFNSIKQSAIAAGKTGTSWADRFGKAFKSILNYVSVAEIIGKTVETGKQMAENVKAVDTSMAGLKRVVNLSNEGMDNLFNKMTASAKNYGATLTDIIDSTAGWARLGFDVDTSERLAEITTMYQHVTDLDNSTAVENLVTAYKGFENQLLNMYSGDQTKAIEYIGDIYNELGNRFAEDASDVGEGLSRSASVLAQGGASIQEAAGMFTGIQEVLQDASTGGTALKILTLRIRGMRGELQELGEDVEGVESISKIQTQLLNLTGGRVNIFDDEGNFRNIYNIMDDIAEVYYELTDTEQADKICLSVQKCA